MRISSNPKREARVYSQWKENATIRTASNKLGIPEGTVAYYYKKFNKHPDKPIQRYEPHSEESSQPPSMESQVLSAITIKDVRDRYHSLIRGEKYHEAKAYLESVIIFDKIMSQLHNKLEGGELKIFGPILFAPEPNPGEDAASYLLRTWAHFKILGIIP